MTRQNLEFIFDPDTFIANGWVNIPKRMIEKIIEIEQGPCTKLDAMLEILLHTNYSDTVYDVKGKSVICRRGESVRSVAQWAKIFKWSRSKTRRFLIYLESIGYIHFIKNSQVPNHFEVAPYEVTMNGPIGKKQTNLKSYKDTEHDESITETYSTNNNNATTHENSNNELNEDIDMRKADCPIPYWMENVYLTEHANQARVANTDKIEHPKKTAITKTGPQKHTEFLEFWNEYYDITGLVKKNIGKAEREWNRLTPKEQKLAVRNIEDYFYSQGNTNYLLQAANYLANKAYMDEF